jgi:hypothetical protein
MAETDDNDRPDERPLEELPPDVLAAIEDAHEHPERLIRGRRRPDDRP